MNRKTKNRFLEESKKRVIEKYPEILNENSSLHDRCFCILSKYPYLLRMVNGPEIMVKKAIKLKNNCFDSNLYLATQKNKSSRKQRRKSISYPLLKSNGN